MHNLDLSSLYTMALSSSEEYVLASVTLHGQASLMGDTDRIEVNIRSAGALVVVADLEVAGGGIEGVCAERLCCTAIDADAEDIAGVANGIGERLSNRDITNRGDDFVATGASLLNTHGENTTRVVVELAYWLRADAVIDMNLANDGAVARVVGLLDSQRHRQFVVGVVRAPAARVAFTQLRTAMLAVGRGDTASV